MTRTKGSERKKAMARQVVPFRLDAGHVLLDLGGVKTLLDTGSPFSFGEVPRLELLGEVHALSPDLQGRVTVASIVEGLRQHTPVSEAFTFQSLLGLDILAGLRLELDWTASELTVSRPGRSGAEAGPGRGTLHVDVQVEGVEAPAYIDTGAWRSYLVPEVAERMPRTGSFTDYNPLLQVLEPELVTPRIGFDGREHRLPVGVATEKLALAIRSLGARVLLGTDVLVPMGRSVLEIPGR